MGGGQATLPLAKPPVLPFSPLNGRKGRGAKTAEQFYTGEYATLQNGVRMV